MAGGCDHEKETLDFIKFRELLHQLKNYQFEKKHSSGPGSSVGIATAFGLDSSGIESR